MVERATRLAAGGAGATRSGLCERTAVIGSGEKSLELQKNTTGFFPRCTYQRQSRLARKRGYRERWRSEVSESGWGSKCGREVAERGGGERVKGIKIRSVVQGAFC